MESKVGRPTRLANLGSNLSHDNVMTPDSDFQELPSPGDWTSSNNGAESASGRDFGAVLYSGNHKSFDNSGRRGFLEGVEVSVQMGSAERSFLHSLSPYLYELRVQHGDYVWFVRRRYHHFRKLHTSLLLARNPDKNERRNKSKKGSTNKKKKKSSKDKKKESKGNISKEESDKEENENDNKEGKQNESNSMNNKRVLRRNSIEQSVYRKPKLSIASSDTETVDVAEDVVDDHGQAGHRRGSLWSRLPELMRRRGLPRFPLKPDSLIRVDELDRRRLQLETYLNRVLKSDFYRNHNACLEFFEVSEFSFVQHLSKGKEGMLRKRVGDDKRGGLQALAQYCCCRTRWRQVWLVVQESFVMGVNPRTGEVRIVMLFDRGFEVDAGLFGARGRHSLVLSNLSRQLYLKTWTRRKNHEWLDAIKARIHATPGKWYVQPNRFDSFAPVRTEQRAKWFVDGESFMAAVADIVSGAKEEIFITDWWLSPEIYLKRGKEFDPNMRLDTLLASKAKSGVKIFVLVYKEVSLALGLNSVYTKRALLSRCGGNLKVMRHPDHAGAEVSDYLWAHHEKTVVVDQKYAFVGGIDLCYGRWDRNSHPLTDLDATASAKAKELRRPNSVIASLPSTSSRTASRPEAGMVLAQVLKAAHVVSVAPVRSFSAQATVQPNVESSVESPSNARTRLKEMLNRAKHRLLHRGDEQLEPRDSDLEETRERRKSLKGEVNEGMDSSDDGDYEDELRESDNNYDASRFLFPGKDYTNFIVKDIVRPDEFATDNVERATTPRLPWHDIALLVQGQVAGDVARHFIQRYPWNSAKSTKAKFSSHLPFLVPRLSPNNFELEEKPESNSFVSCQVLRSLGFWSGGQKIVEKSIQEAMIDAISRSRHYVYIENQFFITKCSQNKESKVIRNQVGVAIVQRILKAHQRGERFRVFIVIPLLPAFEGSIGSSTGIALRTILHYQYTSIGRGPTSLLAELRARGVENVEDYISFCSMRTHDKLGSVPVTELVYVHSKLLIVDDRIVICGSANINDRSLLGSRDSEVAVIVEDADFEDGIMDNKRHCRGKFAGSLRMHLMKEHLGLLNNKDLSKINQESNESIEDPVCDDFFHGVWNKRALLNTQCFEKAFLALPSDSVKSLEQARQWEQRIPLAEFDHVETERILSDVKGYLVQHPLEFLVDDNLEPPAFTKESFVPTVTWT